MVLLGASLQLCSSLPRPRTPTLGTKLPSLTAPPPPPPKQVVRHCRPTPRPLAQRPPPPRATFASCRRAPAWWGPPSRQECPMACPRWPTPRAWPLRSRWSPRSPPTPPSLAPRQLQASPMPPQIPCRVALSVWHPHSHRQRLRLPSSCHHGRLTAGRSPGPPPRGT